MPCNSLRLRYRSGSRGRRARSTTAKKRYISRSPIRSRSYHTPRSTRYVLYERAKNRRKRRTLRQPSRRILRSRRSSRSRNRRFHSRLTSSQFPYWYRSQSSPPRRRYRRRSELARRLRRPAPSIKVFLHGHRW
ncbi:unnamed protein product [Litomosoides sigmodontis]|uniref:Uncharacterized protein n=1 Tax=Litomosoides sigmodontis TaxID=42156 RepID=A0A3P6UYP4_LITSI|nr:unnamed protein product [Litomosoides sigmodontis]